MTCCEVQAALRDFARRYVHVVHILTQGDPRVVTKWWAHMNPDDREALRLGLKLTCSCGKPVNQIQEARP